MDFKFTAHPQLTNHTLITDSHNYNMVVGEISHPGYFYQDAFFVILLCPHYQRILKIWDPVKFERMEDVKDFLGSVIRRVANE